MGPHGPQGGSEHARPERKFEIHLSEPARFIRNVLGKVYQADTIGDLPYRQIASSVADIIEAMRSEALFEETRLRLAFEIGGSVGSDDLVKYPKMVRDAMRDVSIRGRNKHDPAACVPQSLEFFYDIQIVREQFGREGSAGRDGFLERRPAGTEEPG
jgi:hypothetical protein